MAKHISITELEDRLNDFIDMIHSYADEAEAIASHMEVHKTSVVIRQGVDQVARLGRWLRNAQTASPDCRRLQLKEGKTHP